MDAKIRFSFLGDHSASVWGIDMRRKEGKGTHQVKTVALSEGGMIMVA